MGMFGLEEEDELVVIWSERVPWLMMWIHFLVMLLLLLLIFHLLGFDLGLDPAPAPAASPEISTSSAPAAVPTRFLAPKVRGSQCVENATGTSPNRRRGSKEDIHEKEGDSSQFTLFERSHHPCHYLGLARQAFLRCFGLDFTSKDSPSNARQGKDQ